MIAVGPAGRRPIAAHQEEPGPAAESDASERRALAGALLRQLDLGDEADPHRPMLLGVIEQLMQSPTAQRCARAFLAEDISTRVRFGPTFLKGAADWTEGLLTVTLNEAYLDDGIGPAGPSLPVVLCHEMFGHGLWHARAHRHKAFQAIHHHELAEVYARLIHWAVEVELEGRPRGSDAESYLADPAGYLAQTKLDLPYYALTFSSAELRQPIEAIEGRIRFLMAKRPESLTRLRTLRSWMLALGDLVRRGVVAEGPAETLRRALAADAEEMRRQRRSIGETVIELTGILERIAAEADRQSERYLIWAADCPVVLDLTRETEDQERRLRALIGSIPPVDPVGAGQAERDGQITFDDLVELYRRDRAENPHHWTAG